MQRQITQLEGERQSGKGDDSRTAKLLARQMRRNAKYQSRIQELGLDSAKDILSRTEQDLRLEDQRMGEIVRLQLISVREQIEAARESFDKAIDQVREQIIQRDIANEKAVNKAEIAASTAVKAAVDTSILAVTKTEQSGAEAISKAEQATKALIDTVKESFEKDILSLSKRFDTYAGSHKEVHDTLQIALTKAEEQFGALLSQLAEFQRTSSITAQSNVNRDQLDDFRRVVEQQSQQRYEGLNSALERIDISVNSRLIALESRIQSSLGRDTASTQYFGYIFAAVLAVAAGVIGHLVK